MINEFKNSNKEHPNGYMFKLYPLMVALFVILQIECILFVSKQIDIFHLSTTLSGITFPINLLILAIVVNCYGKQSARQLVWINNVIVIQFVIYNLFAHSLAWSPNSHNAEVIISYKILIPVFVKSGLAGLFAENIAEFLFVFLYAKYQNKKLIHEISFLNEWLKLFIYGFAANFTMLLISYSIIFSDYSFKDISILICHVMLLKSIIEVIFSPIAIYIIIKIKNFEGFDVRDLSGNNPFAFLIKYEYLNFYQVDNDSRIQK
jgi:uncharacterized PurR-regulated membrane protein YhhQ (DUF165 family)